MRSQISLLFLLSGSAPFFNWLSFFLFIVSLARYEPSFIVSWYFLWYFRSFLIFCNTFKILPNFLLIFLHSYHSFPLFLSHVFYFFYCHDSHFFNAMINFLIIQWLHYRVPFDHPFQLFLTFFVRKYLMTFLINQINWLVSRT